MDRSIQFGRRLWLVLALSAGIVPACMIETTGDSGDGGGGGSNAGSTSVSGTGGTSGSGVTGGTGGTPTATGGAAGSAGSGVSGSGGTVGWAGSAGRAGGGGAAGAAGAALGGTGGSSSGGTGGDPTDLSATPECTAFCQKLMTECGSECDLLFDCQVGSGQCAASELDYMRCVATEGRLYCSGGSYAVVGCSHDESLCGGE